MHAQRRIAERLIPRLFLTIGALIVAAGCSKPASRWDAAQEATEGKKEATAATAIDGGELNQFFPPQGDG